MITVSRRDGQNEEDEENLGGDEHSQVKADWSRMSLTGLGAVIYRRGALLEQPSFDRSPRRAEVNILER